jgi:hypothetical protein
VGHEYAKALKSVGVPSVSVSIGEHGYKYPSTGVVVDHPLDVAPFVRSADIIVFMHSSYVELGDLYKKRRLFVMHGGTSYRQHFRELNPVFNEMVEKCIIQTADLLGKGAKNEVWLPPPVDLERIQPVYEAHGEKPIIAHYPSNQWKGTGMIEGVIRKLAQEYDFEYRQSCDIKPWEENHKRMSECDIYIDGICPKQGSERYGEWGVQTLEAMALGKITLAHGSMPGPIIVNDPATLAIMLKSFLIMSDQSRLDTKKAMRRIVEKHHSYKAIGKRLKEEILELQ